MNWTFLNTFNSTGFKGWSVGWLWIYTGGVWGFIGIGCTVATAVVGHEVKPPTEWLFTWLGGLTAYSGVSYFQNKTMRETDYGALERKAQIEAAKAGTPTTGQTRETPTK